MVSRFRRAGLWFLKLKTRRDDTLMHWGGLGVGELPEGGQEAGDTQGMCSGRCWRDAWGRSPGEAEGPGATA